MNKTNKNKVWILGPCSMESKRLFLDSLKKIDSIMSPTDEWYMKASFDKANRTSLHGGRGPGLEYAKEVWAEAKSKYPNVKFITDVHEVHQVEQLIGHVDVLQIPAFLCRQTDLIVESAKYFDKINIKKGQWLENPSTRLRKQILTVKLGCATEALISVIMICLLILE